MYTSETRFPLADATLVIPPYRLERLKNTFERHGATVGRQEKDIYHVLFPVGTMRIELALTNPQQHRIFFPDGFSFLIIDPPQERP